MCMILTNAGEEGIADSLIYLQLSASTFFFESWENGRDKLLTVDDLFCQLRLLSFSHDAYAVNDLPFFKEIKNKKLVSVTL